jgi:tetratricopeptide (TPR) repeat protein
LDVSLIAIPEASSAILLRGQPLTMTDENRNSPSGGADTNSAARESVALGDRFSQDGRYDEALAQFQQGVDAEPENAGYRVKLGRCAWLMRRSEVAEFQLEEAFRLAPDDPQVNRLLAEFCCAHGKMDRALFHSGRAHESKPDDAEIIVNRAAVLHESLETEAAWRLVEPLLKAGYCSVSLGLLYSRLAPATNREAAALSYVGFLLQSGRISKQDEVKLRFAAAALLDRAERYDQAFEQARLGKEASRPVYDPFHVQQWIDLQIDYFTPDTLSRLARATHGSRRPLFIIGMPRSGTSLVEQILASHSQVHGAGELRTLMSLRRSIWSSPWGEGQLYPDVLDSMTVAHANELAGVYLSTISSRCATATYVIDKMPDNFLLLGLIATLFPHSHVIHCTRDRLDTCLSCYMTYFVAGQDYSHDLTHLGSFYRDYERLMAHWQTALEYPLIEVNYERLVSDLDGQTRRLLSAIGLPWEDDCLRFYQNRRPVLTASSDQVRRPIYASSVGRWKHYAKHLSPLLAALGQGS